MTTCTAPTLPAISGATDHPHHADHWHRHEEPAHCEQHRNEHGRSAVEGVPWFGYCPAPAPLTCEGTDWPPMTSTQRYAEDRRLGQRVPPSVSVWRPEDVRRQQEADARIRARATKRPAVVVAWEPGPSCEGKSVR